MDRLDVGEDVARDHQEALGQVLPGVGDRAGGAQRDLLDHVRHPYAELGAVTEVVPYGVGQERERDDDVVEAMAGQQVDDVDQAVDRHGHVLDINPAARSILGLAMGSAVTGLGVRICVTLTGFLATYVMWRVLRRMSPGTIGRQIAYLLGLSIFGAILLGLVEMLGQAWIRDFTTLTKIFAEYGVLRGWALEVGWQVPQKAFKGACVGIGVDEYEAGPGAYLRFWK